MRRSREKELFMWLRQAVSRLSIWALLALQRRPFADKEREVFSERDDKIHKDMFLWFSRVLSVVYG